VAAQVERQAGHPGLGDTGAEVGVVLLAAPQAGDHEHGRRAGRRGPQDAGQRRLLRRMVGLSALAAIAVGVIQMGRGSHAMPVLEPPDRTTLALYAGMVLAAGACLAFYWKKLTARHRLSAPALGVLAAFDRRVVAVFGMAAVVVLAATVFQRSIDSDRWRPLFKKAEWYFFWVVLVTALGLALSA